MTELSSSFQTKPADAILTELMDEAERIHLREPSTIFFSEESRLSDVCRDAVAQHVSIFPRRYVASLSGQEIVSHMKLLSKMGEDDQQYVVSCELLPAQVGNDAVVKIIVVCLDIPKIFNHINMALEQLTLSTIEASILSTTTGLAFDEFISKVDVHYAKQCDKLEADILSLLQTKPINTLTKEVDSRTDQHQSQQKVAISRNDELCNSLRLNKKSVIYTPLHSSDVKLVRKIGAGQVCETFEGVLLSSGQPVAVKKPHHDSCKDWNQSREKYLELWRQEVLLMELIGQHPNICTFVGMSQSNNSCDSTFLCYEYLSGGCLSDVIADPTIFLDPMQVAMDVARGMCHLHGLGIMHRDLKPANVILDSSGCAKIADFGLSCQVKTGCEMTAETGTYRWMAPEVIRHEQYGLAADVYSFGILLWELFARTRPFDELTPFQAAYQVALDQHRPPLPANMSPDVARLLASLWHQDPAARPSFPRIVGTLDALLGT